MVLLALPCGNPRVSRQRSPTPPTAERYILEGYIWMVPLGAWKNVRGMMKSTGLPTPTLIQNCINTDIISR